MNRQEALAHIQQTCGAGWLNLVDIAFDNLPEGETIDEVFQKWGGLMIRISGENEIYQELLDNIYAISQKMCEICGKSAQQCIMDGWETALCKMHFEASNAQQKYRSTH
jgi:hypothetical protein